jgi:phosphoglycolate phosphatase
MAARALLFDLDGTVWDSFPWYARALAGASAASYAQVLDELRRGASIVRLLARHGVRETELRRPSEALRLYPGVRNTLDTLTGLGVALAAVTNLPGRIVMPMLDATGLSASVSVVIHAGNCRPLKPHPRPILAAIDQLGMTRRDPIYYIGDLPADAEAAARAGVPFAWASYGYGKERPSAARVTLLRFADVLAL